MAISQNLSEKLLARHWGLSHQTLKRPRSDNRGKAYLKLGGRVMNRLVDIEAYDGRQMGPPAAPATKELRRRRRTNCVGDI